MNNTRRRFLSVLMTFVVIIMVAAGGGLWLGAKVLTFRCEAKAEMMESWAWSWSWPEGCMVADYPDSKWRDVPL